MTTPQPDPRRVGRVLARAGVVGSGVMLAVSAFGLSPAGLGTAGAAGTDSGTAIVIQPFDGSPEAGDPITGGNSATAFSLLLPTGAACPGDSANAGWNVTSFMVPASVDVSSLQFDPVAGPNPADVGAAFRQPLYDSDSGSAFTGKQTADANPPGGPGPVINIGSFNLSKAGFLPGNIPAGTYKLGIACIKGAPSATQMANFWTAQIVVADATANASNPAGLTFTVAGGGGTTTTTTVAGGTTTTTVAGATTTSTVAGATTTSTTAGDGTTTTTAGDGTTTSTTTGSGVTTTTSAAGVSNGLGGSLPTTGSSPAALVMWAFFLLVCGRMAVVLGRPAKVRTPRA